ncbi:MAG: hypothetical protein ACLSAP_05500 [Oscillospiraceae bacterium]
MPGMHGHYDGVVPSVSTFIISRMLKAAQPADRHLIDRSFSATPQPASRRGNIAGADGDYLLCMTITNQFDNEDMEDAAVKNPSQEGIPSWSFCFYTCQSPC